MKNKILVLALTSLAASGFRSQASQIGVDLADWNIITSGNLEDVSDYDGNAYVGGNVTVGNSFDVGNANTQGHPAGNVSLAVAGNISGGNPINVDSGNVVVGGSISGRSFNNNGGGTVTQGNPAAVPASPVAQVTSASHYWSGLAANSSVAVANNNITFNCAANQSLAVFNISASQLFAQNQNPVFNLAGSTVQILVNVSGTTAAELNSENFGNNRSLAEEVVWNFYQATSVALSGGIDGYVVAPDATVTGSSPIVGGVMAQTLDTTSEVELGSGTANYASAPDLVSSVPDGGTTAALLGLAFSGVAVIRRKFAV
jgi:choice-of-anchor A domain-containing protein